MGKRDRASAEADGARASDQIRRTLRVVLSVACERLFKDRTLTGGYSIANAHWFMFEGDENAATKADAAKIDQECKDLIRQGMKLSGVERDYKAMIEYFTASRQPVAAKQLENRVPIGGSAKVWEIDVHGTKHYRLRHFPLLEDTSSLDGYDFSLKSYTAKGFVLIHGPTFSDQPSLTKSIARQLLAANRAGVRSTADVCAIADSDSARGVFVHSAEARLEAQILEVTNRIVQKHGSDGDLQVVCVAGPTASGKTTFSHKLCLGLQNAGISSSPLTVDHYYLPLDQQPKYKVRKDRNDVDYDSIESMDLDLVQDHIVRLAAGETVTTPVYNMKTGYRDLPGKPMKLERGGVLIIEGIHALNPEYTAKISATHKFKIFISPIPALQIDDFNVVKSTDHRLCRRISRDYLFRGNSAARTLKMWANVRVGEEKWIFPHQNHADYVVNSAMEYEVATLKGRLEGLLRSVTPEAAEGSPLDCPIFRKAQEMLHVLDCVSFWTDKPIPCASLMREFIGGAAFDVH
mmetsp:Transcript_51019/g.127048  ORF Transcript_51019/g.127048 Transcript_51019/m.127048 type:complete len:519 (+) Transcript_51019:39-1595(+)